MFDQDQIQEFKEAFNMIDQNRDGFIDHDDLKDMLASLGKDVSDDYLDDMMNQAPGAINFTMFLTLFGERLQGTDPEDVIRNAFGCFDETMVGTLNEDYLRELLTTLGDRFTQDEVDDLYKEAPIKNGQFDYVEFTRILKHGAKDPDDKWITIQNMKNTRSLICASRVLNSIFFKYLLTPIQILAFYFCPPINVCSQLILYYNNYVFSM